MTLQVRVIYGSLGKGIILLQFKSWRTAPKEEYIGVAEVQQPDSLIFLILLCLVIEEHRGTSYPQRRVP